MNLFKIVLYPTSKKDFFDLLYNINCDARDYIGCTNVDKYFDIKKVEKQELTDIGGNIKVSKPIDTERGLRVGSSIYASISHNGVVAIYSLGPSSKPGKGTEDKGIIQFTDLSSTRQVEMEVERAPFPMSYGSLVGFYDNSMVLLTNWRPLREATVESVFDNPILNVFKGVGSDGVYPDTDVSLLHMTRVLYYFDTSLIPYEYNVDTHTNTKLDIGKNVLSFASMTGIDVGVKGIFQGNGGGYFTFILNKDNSTTKIGEEQPGYLRSFLSSSTCPFDIKKGMSKYDACFIFNNEKIDPTTPIKFYGCQSLVRICKDIFLTYDDNTKQWVLVRIVTP